jgi:hypothetical protein
MKKNYYHPTFLQYKKKITSIYFLFTVWKKIHKRKKIKREKIKIRNILKGKKVQVKEISC